MNHPMLTFWEFSPYGPPGANVDFPEGKDGTLEQCGVCGRWITTHGHEGARLKVGGSGSKWPDILSSMPCIVIQDRVANAIRENGLTGCRLHPTEIVSVENRRLAALEQPAYWMLEVTGTVDVDLDELDDHGGGVCPGCHSRDAQPGPHRFAAKRVVPKLETWDGSDFVKTGNWRTGHSYCTRRFVDLACAHRWKNFRFGTRNSMPGVGMWSKPNSLGISYLDPDWFETVSRAVRERNADLFG